MFFEFFGSINRRRRRERDTDINNHMVTYQIKSKPIHAQLHTEGAAEVRDSSQEAKVSRDRGWCIERVRPLQEAGLVRPSDLTNGFSDI